MSAPFSICPDCGENVGEFILHKDSCPKFGQEVQEFIAAYEADVATWPEGAQKALDDLNAMHANLFRKWLALEHARRDINAELHDDLIRDLYIARKARNEAKLAMQSTAARIGNCQGFGAVEEYHACWASRKPEDRWCDIRKEKLPIWKDYRKKVTAAATALRAVLREGKRLSV